MTRGDLVLAVLAAAGGKSYTPVQIQKALFLLSENLPTVIDQGPGFNFSAYDYGPFDAMVYTEAEGLASLGDADVRPSSKGRWKTYAATDQGVVRGRQLIEGLPTPTRIYLISISEWVRKLDFRTLVKSIYEAYPDMKENSIFRG